MQRFFDDLASVLVIVGGLNWGAEALGTNFVKKVASFLANLLSKIGITVKDTDIEAAVYAIVGLAAVYLGIRMITTRA